MEILSIIIWCFLAIRIFVSLVNLLSGLHLSDQKPATFPKVSILIPARNEEDVIGKLLTDLHQLDYPDFEVLICNDHSSDNTEEILNWFAGEDERFHWFLGEKLHDDWSGKNFACHQLAQKAKGVYFLFLDADVELAPDAVTKAVAFFQKVHISLLTVFPQQKMNSLGEQVTVPVMNWILQSLLPMILARKIDFPALSAANGQFMMFDGQNYRENQWHSKVMNETVEDILIARMIKSEGHQMAVLLGNHDVFCRMYTHFNEAVTGFSRNMHEYFGGKRWMMLSFSFMVCFGPFIVFYSLGWVYLGLFVFMVVVNRILVAFASRQNWLGSVLLHPIQMLSFTAIVFYNIYLRIRKKTEWKVRKIKL